MAGSDLTILDERKNLLALFRAWENICLSQGKEAMDYFKLIYDVWESVSAQLWFLVYWNDYFQCGNIVLKCAQIVDNVAIQAQLLSEMGWVCMEWEELTIAKEYFNEALLKYQLLGQTIEQCKLLRYLGVFQHREGQFSSDLDYYHQALEIMNANREKVNIDTKWAFYEAEIPNLLGCAYMDLQDFQASYRELKLSIEKYQFLVQTYPQEREYYRYYKADPLLNLGQWHYLQGDYNEARKYYQECLQLCQEISRPDTMSGVLLRLAELAEVEGNEEEALKLASEAEEVAGTEVTSVREKAARFRDKLLKKKQHIASHI